MACLLKRVGILLLLFAGFLPASATYAQEWDHYSIPAGALTNLTWNPHQTRHVVGYHSSSRTIFQSLDSGQSWTERTDSLPPPPYDRSHFWYHPESPDTMYFIEPTRLFRSYDSGANWTSVTPENVVYLSNVEVAESRASRLILQNGSTGQNPYLISNDYGDSWSSLTVPENGRLLRIDPFDADHWIIGQMAAAEDVLLESEDAGATWEEYPPPFGDYSFGMLEEIQFDPSCPDTLYTCWDDGIDLHALVRSTTSPSPSLTVVGGAEFFNVDRAGTLVALAPHFPLFGDYDTYMSMDGGDNWTRIAEWAPYSGHYDGSATRAAWFVPSSSNPQTGLVGAGDNLYYTQDGGLTASSIATGIKQASITGIRHAGEVIDVLTANGQFWRLRPDQPIEWPSLTNFVSQVASLTPSADTLFVAGFGFRRSSDGGQNWAVTSGTDYVNNTTTVLTLPSDPPRVLFDYNDRLYKSTDLGESYNPVDNTGLPATWGGFDLYSNPASPNQIWCVTFTGLYLSEDYGDHFTLELETESPFVDLHMTAGNGTLYLLTPEGMIRYWIRGNEAPTTIHVPAEIGPVFSIALRPGTLGHLFIGTNSGVFETDDYGANWSDIEGDFEGSITTLAFSEDGADLYVGTRQDGLWVATNLFTPNTVEPTATSNLPRTITLHPAWPNPFNASTRIAYDLPRAGQVQVTVYDLLGRRVALLEKGLRSEGRHEVTWKANAASGTYIVRLQSGAVDYSQRVMLVR